MLSKQCRGPTTHVTFRIPLPLTATHVTLVGEFNGWNETATPLQRTPEGWSTTLELPRGRTFQYRYLADGRWLNDWAADHYVPNELGGDDSVVRT